MKIYNEFLEKHRLTALEACCLFAHKNLHKISTWIVGFNSPKELEEFLIVMKNKIVRDDVDFDLPVKRDHFLDPRTWSYIKSC